MWSGLLAGAAKLSYCRYVRILNLVRLFRKDLQPAEKLNGETTIENFNITRGVLGVTYFCNTILSSADERFVLLYIEARAAYTRYRKQTSC